MLITRIAAKNYKTYKDLDLNLEVNLDQPLVLIGGLNGGGKTTLFQAIYSSLYGLEIENEDHFKRLVNASVPYNRDVRIELEIDFKGKVLMQDAHYKIKRVYAINSQGMPMESVHMNFNGSDFKYGSAMPYAKRAKAEAEVNKIIKANLPKELSKYFLFDAMESGDLLEKDYLARVIRENIENVMGFNKYYQLKEATTKIKEKYIAESIDLEAEREEYTRLVNEKETVEKQIAELSEEHKIKLGYSIDKKDLYKKAKDGANLQKEYQEKIRYVQKTIDDLEGKQKEYILSISQFTNDVELQAFLPKLVHTIREELELIIAKTEGLGQSEVLNAAQLEMIQSKLHDFIEKEDLFDGSGESVSERFITYLERSNAEKEKDNPYGFLSTEELDTIKILLNKSTINSYSFIVNSKETVENELKQLPALRAQLEEMKGFLTSDENSIIQAFEANENRLRDIKEMVQNLETKKDKLNTQIHKYDIPDEEVPNPKLELCKKIEPIFEEIASELLKVKKSRIEETMKEDLNATLTVYSGVIGRVELSQNLSNLNFKIFHTAGNEIYLEELNAASKQIIVQVLLKALHQFGDYNPPVMIDTVMGYLDEESRASLLENYFPKLSHQTILFSTNTEIRKDVDLVKIEEFISKKYTLKRDKDKQLTTIDEGYFN